MKQFLVCISMFLFFFLRYKTSDGEFTISGEIKNAPDQKLYLEEISFNQKPPLIIDTAELKKI